MTFEQRVNFRSRTAQVKVPPNSEVLLPADCTYIRCLTSNTAFKVGVGVNGEFSDMEAGLGFGDKEYNTANIGQIRIKNTSSSTTLEAKLALSTGQVDDSRANISGSLTVTSGSNIETPAAITVGTSAVQLVAYDADATGVLVQNLGSATIFVGDATVTAAKGIAVLPNSSFSIDTSGEVWAISASAGNDVRILREKA